MRIEVYNSLRGQFLSPHDGCVWFAYRDAFRRVQWHRKRIRVRTFYDRHLKTRVVQILAGNGYGVRP